MSGTEQPGAPTSPADVELADAMQSIDSTGEDWRSSERGSGPADPATDHEQDDDV